VGHLNKKEYPQLQIYRPLNLLEHSLLQKLLLLENKKLISPLHLIRSVNKSAMLDAKYLKNQNNSIFASYNN
jgi:hypothetical protein